MFGWFFLRAACRFLLLQGRPPSEQVDAFFFPLTSRMSNNAVLDVLIAEVDVRRLLYEARELSLPLFGGRVVVATRSLRHIHVAEESLLLMYRGRRAVP